MKAYFHILEFPYFLFLASKSLHHYDDVSFLKLKIKNTETQVSYTIFM